MVWTSRIIAIIAFGRSAYSFWYLAVGLLARFGVAQPLGATTFEAEALGHLPALQYMVWAAYASGYSLVGVMLLARSGWVVPIVVATVTVDMSYWILMLFSDSYSALTALADGYVDLFINIANFTILIGSVLLAIYWSRLTPRH